MNSTTPFRVLFVCMGNICRSPAGENIFRHFVTREGLQQAIETDSAGTIDYHVGHRPDRRMCQTLKKRGIPSEGSARQFQASDYEKFDLILTMDGENFSHVTRLAPDQASLDKVKPFSVYCSQEQHRIPDVPDPYYGGADGFEFVADMLEDGCQTLLESLRDPSA